MTQQPAQQSTQPSTVPAGGAYIPDGVAQPQDHQSRVFTYQLVSGRTVTLPRFETVLTFGRARRLRKLSEQDQAFELIEEIVDEPTLAMLDEMDQQETEAFFAAWQADSGVSLGESQRSSS